MIAWVRPSRHSRAAAAAAAVRRFRGDDLHPLHRYAGGFGDPSNHVGWSDQHGDQCAMVLRLQRAEQAVAVARPGHRGTERRRLPRCGS